MWERKGNRGGLTEGVGWWGGKKKPKKRIESQNNWHEMKCRQSRGFTEHKTVSRG